MLGIPLCWLLLAQQPSAPAGDWQRIRAEALAISQELIAIRQSRSRSEQPAVLAMLKSSRPSIVQLGIEAALKGSDVLKEAALKAAFSRIKGFYLWSDRDPYVQYLTIELFEPETGTLTYRGRGNRRANGRISSTIELPELSTSTGLCSAVFMLDATGVARGTLKCGGPKDLSAIIDVF